MDSTKFRDHTGRVIWITGLSGSGKSTLAREVCRQMKIQGVKPLLLDGDELRGSLTNLLSSREQYSTDSRRALAASYSRLSHLFALQGHLTVVATVSLFHSVQIWNRANIPRYFEVFLDTSIEVLQKRDSKRLYSGNFRANVNPIMGLDVPGEFPVSPDLRYVNFDINNLEIIAAEIIDYLAISSNSGTDE